MRFLIVLLLAVQTSCVVSQTAQQVRRQPLQRSEFRFSVPQQYERRITGYNPQTGEPINYDHRPRIEVIDERAGRYALRWIGYDGQEKTILYQRHDAIDVIVATSVSVTPEGGFLYDYNIRNLSTSGTFLSFFMVQNFADNVQPTNTERGFVGSMSNQIHVFREGNWIGFGWSYIGNDVTPGREISLKLSSPAPPGLVRCRVHGGPTTLQGVGEDMPPEIDDALPGYEVLPRGYTIGPVDTLRNASPTQRANYLLERLPQLQEIGWITPSARQWYETNLRSNNFQAIIERAERDLQAEQITSEVFALIQNINR